MKSFGRQNRIKIHGKAIFIGETGDLYKKFRIYEFEKIIELYEDFEGFKALKENNDVAAVWAKHQVSRNEVFRLRHPRGNDDHYRRSDFLKHFKVIDYESRIRHTSFRF